MRSLFQPRVLKLAVNAALITALVCYPRLALWPEQERRLPIWFLETAIFLTTSVLWGFVFAWHTKYTRLPVFTLKLNRKLLAGATVAGLLAAFLWHTFIDPRLRTIIPQDYPTTFWAWLAGVLFTLSLSQLFLVFAPFAWLVRIFQNRTVATALTMLLGVLVLVLKARSVTVPTPADLLATLLVFRIAIGIVAVLLYLRGGVLLVWWCALLIEARHWLDW